LEAGTVTPKQSIFAREYLIDLNATQAALRAGYKLSYAKRACFVLLRKPDVAASVAEGMAARAKRTEIDADRVMREYAKLAFADIAKLATWGKKGVELREHTEISADDTAAIVELSRAGKIKIHDKRAALDALARHLGAFNKENAPGGRDLRSHALAKARAALKERIEKIIAERPQDGAETEPEKE
jgi:phage terminase small subunit